MDNFVETLEGGVDGLVEYLPTHVITCLVSALFIGGAFAVSPSYDDSKGACL